MSYRSPFASHSVARTFLTWTSVAAPAIALLGFGWYLHINATPTAPDAIPSPTMPEVNAYDTLLLADSQKVRTKEIDIAESTRPVEHEHVYTPAEKAELVAANAQALATLHLALTQPYASHPVRSFDQRLPELAKFRGLARMLTLEAQVREANGDHAGAVQSNIDAVALGVMIPRGGPIIHSLVGTACVSIGDRPLWNRVDHLDAPQAAAAARRLEALNDQSIAYPEVLREEKLFGEASLIQEFTGKSTFMAWQDIRIKTYSESGDDSGNILSFGQFLSGCVQLAPYSKQDILNHYANFMNGLIGDYSANYHVEKPKEIEPHDPISDLIGGVFTQAEFKARSARMGTGLLSCTLALRSYRLSHGAYPTALSELVSAGILAHVPNDPFATNVHDAALRYRRLAGDKFLLYSVGADAVDDGGKPVDLTRGDNPKRHWLEASDKGDWVVGADTFEAALQ